jgi:N,N-dimethylformamidase
MNIVGYADRLSVAAGETIQFMVSCQLPTYHADIVRLLHGDPNPHGPGFKEELIETPVSQEYPGREQVIYSGSYVVVPDSPHFAPSSGFTLQAWISPTTPSKGEQGLLTKWSANGAGYGLLIDENGELALWLGAASGQFARIRSGKALRASEWYFVAASYDAQTGEVQLSQEPQRAWPRDDTLALVSQKTQMHTVGAHDADFLIAASWQRSANGEILAGRHFNGKIDNPCFFGRALSQAEIVSLKRGASPLAFGSTLIAAWDFSADISSTQVTDTAPHGLHGHTINMPTRAMTGHNWTGKETNYRHALHEYGAIHFHDDDLDNARWHVDFTLTIPTKMKSGVYAARLRAGEGCGYFWTSRFWRNFSHLRTQGD